MTERRPTRLLLTDLRRIGHNPPRTLHEALRIAQRQAKNLLLLTGTYEPPVPTAILERDPKLELRWTNRLQRVSGLCRWIGWRYVISVNRREPMVRQRFTIFHELKHAIDGASTTAAINRFTRPDRRSAAEAVADYFASCVLMPEPWVAAAVARGDDLDRLVRNFSVSKEAMRVRLAQLGVDPARSHAGRVPTGNTKGGRS